MPGWKKDGLTGRGSDDIICPFFQAHSEKAILCEGHIPDTKTEIKFKTKGEKNKQQEVYCEGIYKKCEHYIAVMHFRWPEDDK